MTIQDWWGTTLSSLIGNLESVLGIALPIIGALIILYIGWLVGKLLERLIHLIAAATAPTDEEIAKSAIGQFLTSVGTRFSISEILRNFAWVVKWFFYVSAFTAAMSVLALSAVNSFMQEAAAFFPNAAAGALFMFIGVVLGRFLQTVLQRILNTFHMPGSDITGIVAYWAVLVFAFFAVLRHFGVALDAVLVKFPDMLVIAVGIAIGLGFSGKFADILERLRKGL